MLTFIIIRYRPVTVRQLLEIKHANPSAKLIGGSTETQIETKFKGSNYSASVYVGDIAELRQYHISDEYTEIGGNVSLTDVENIMKEALDRYGERRGQPFAAILSQLRYFAGRQIRNVGAYEFQIRCLSLLQDVRMELRRHLHGQPGLPYRFSTLCPFRYSYLILINH